MEERNLYTIVYLITNAFNIVLLMKFMHIFYNQRRKGNILCALSYLSHFILSSTVYLLVDIPLLTLILNYFIIFGIALNYKASLQKHFLSALYILIFMLIPEFIIAICTGYFQFSFFTKGNYSDVLGVVAMRLLTFILVLLLERFKAVRQNHPVSIFLWAASIMIPLITLIMEIMLLEGQNVSQVIAVFSVILMFTLNITAFYLYDSLAESYMQKSQLALLEKENELYCKQCDIMQSATEELQTFRHDLNNQLIVVSEMLEKEDFSVAKKQIYGLLGRIKTKAIYSTTGNVPIDSIINYKLQNAVMNHIDVRTEIAVPSDIGIDVFDSITILGNLLDNALTAIIEMPESERFIEVKLTYGQGRFMIHIVNPFSSEIQYENGEIATTKENRTQHGFGLKNIEKAVERYYGVTDIQHKNNIFTVDIVMYLPE